MIQKIINWNINAGNKPGEIDFQLEKEMLFEEIQETFKAMDRNDKVEVVDGLIDTCFVAIGTLHKLGLGKSMIEECFKEVIVSNNSKFPFEKKENGKVGKNKNFIPPNIKDILERNKII